MPDRASGSAADRNMLLGILAVQMDFITRDALVAAMHAWVMAKHRPLGDLLEEQGALTPPRRRILDLLADEHLNAHGGDLQRSLAVAGAQTILPGGLDSLADVEVQASLSAASRLQVTTDELRPAADGVRYRVLRPHARGGLGVVSVACDAELGREVALKEIDAAHARDAANRGRFVREAEITGGLEHPGIVPVYGLGRYADGRPYYAMRLIRGETLEQAARSLHEGGVGYTLRGLLTRFVAVCNAVAFAHSRGVIHRDLKPANVMLGPFGETLVVDWGLAKVVGRQTDFDDADAATMTLQTPSGEGSVTQAGSALGTPAFMSPEQARGAIAMLGPATDVYSLGATLHALLTGEPPVRGRSTAEVLEKVRRGEWKPAKQVKPSTPRALDAVCCKAMALRAEDRYGSALDLAADVERWLGDEPVTACREPWLTRVARWGRRHRQFVAVSAATLVIAAAASLWVAVDREQARRATSEAEHEARQQRDAAAARESETNAVLAFVEDKVFAAARPKGQDGGLGREVRLRQVVEAALPFVEKSFRDQPLIEAKLRVTLGISFLALSEPQIAAEQFETARGIYTKLLGPDHPDTLVSLHDLANSYSDLGRHAEACALREETLALSRSKLGFDHPDTLKRMNNLANSYNDLGRLVEALKLREETLTLNKTKFGPDHPETLACMNNLALSYSDLGRDADALKLHQETLALRTARLGPEHRDTIGSMSNLAQVYLSLGRCSEALPFAKKTLALRTTVLGPDHAETLKSMSILARCYAEAGRHVEALELREKTLALSRQKLGVDHPDTIGRMSNLASSYNRLRRFTEAIKLREEALARQKATRGVEHPETIATMYSLAADYYGAGRYADTAELGKQTLDLRRKKLGPDHPETLESLAIVATSYANLGRYVESLTLHEQALALRQAKLPANHPDTLETLYNIACCRALMAANTSDRNKQADLAMEYLRKAVDGGYKDLALIKRDHDLDILRVRDDFKKLVAELESKVAAEKK
jgi:tetratricopeptide (TPR) repeat protein